MAKSLQEQLLAAGLADEKKAKQVRQEKRKAKKQGKGQAEEAERRLQAQKALEEKARRDREINLQRQAEADRKALQAQVRQLVEQHRTELKDGDTPYNFVVDGKVKKIYLTQPLCDQLASGRAAIVVLEGAYHVIPADAAQKIRERDPETLIIQHKPETPDSDDPYADYPIPDDLMW